MLYEYLEEGYSIKKEKLENDETDDVVWWFLLVNWKCLIIAEDKFEILALKLLDLFQ